MPFLNEEYNNPNQIIFLNTYYPYRIKNEWGKFIRNPNFNSFSGLVLDLKEGKPGAINHFFNLLNPHLKDNILLTYVPSHIPANKDSGVKRLATKLASQNNRVDATSCLVRHSKIAKLTNGGDRNQEVHLQSIHLENSHLIEGKTVLILDDVTTTYNSLFACQKILLDHGAKKVNCLAIGETGGY